MKKSVIRGLPPGRYPALTAKQQLPELKNKILLLYAACLQFLGRRRYAF
jgi:hypothetical protein